VDEPLTALLRSYRSTEIDAAYATADQDHLLEDHDEWSDLASFRSAASATSVNCRNAVNLDSVESISVAVLVERIGSLSGSQMREICRPLQVATDCE